MFASPLDAIVYTFTTSPKKAALQSPAVREAQQRGRESERNSGCGDWIIWESIVTLEGLEGLEVFRFQGLKVLNS